MLPMKRLKVLLPLVAAVTLLAAGCNSSSTSNNPQSNNSTDSGSSAGTNGSATFTPATQQPGASGAATSVPPSTATPQTLTVSLNGLNNSGQSGTATLTEQGDSDRTVVTINMSGEQAGANEPAHIHIGACPNPGNVVYPLENVRNGQSSTTIPVSLSALLGRLPLAINVHQSQAQINNYVSCGDITAP